ncbi:MAG: DUF739 family protein [Desulfobacteraceae bacterium]|nr:MAG: DUF739 family protein [Desulfobacteraceae bacterium]
MNRRLKAKIVEKYGSQWQFSRAIGIHESIISGVIRGRRALSEEDRKVWAHALEEEPASSLFEFQGV